jgi:hypothetical protein
MPDHVFTKGRRGSIFCHLEISTELPMTWTASAIVLFVFTIGFFSGIVFALVFLKTQIDTMMKTFQKAATLIQDDNVLVLQKNLAAYTNALLNTARGGSSDEKFFKTRTDHDDDDEEGNTH